MDNTGEKLSLYVADWLKKTNLKICFLLSGLPNPRLNKRIRYFQRFGDVTVVHSQCRGGAYQHQKVVEGVKYVSVDVLLPSSVNLFARYKASRHFKRQVDKYLMQNRPDIVFVDTLDGIVCADEYKKNKRDVKVIYEVADLCNAYISTPQSIFEYIKFGLVKRLEKKHFGCIDLLTITSPKFFDVYYRRLISFDNCVFIPNAPEVDAFKEYRKKNDGKFTVGFVGGLRYYPQLKMLADASQVVGCDVIFAGSNDGSKEYLEFEKYAKQFANIKFTGRFNFEKEAAGLYSQLDCVYCVYGLDDPNAKVLLPNKLYEAIICKLPILGSRGTYLGELIDAWGVGLIVSDTNTNELVEALKKLRDDDELRQKIERHCEERYCELGL